MVYRNFKGIQIALFLLNKVRAAKTDETATSTITQVSSGQVASGSSPPQGKP